MTIPAAVRHDTLPDGTTRTTYGAPPAREQLLAHPLPCPHDPNITLQGRARTRTGARYLILGIGPHRLYLGPGLDEVQARCTLIAAALATFHPDGPDADAVATWMRAQWAQACDELAEHVLARLGWDPDSPDL